MWKTVLAAGASLALLFCWVTDGHAGEFVTPEVSALPGRTIPFCSSTFGCFLSGAPLPPPGQTIAAPLPSLGQGASAVPIADAATEPTVRRYRPKAAAKVTIAADPMELDRMRGLLALMPTVDVRIVPTTNDEASTGTDFSVTSGDDQPGAGMRTELFAKQLHILAASDILSVEGLRNKVVSFGPDRSASQALARRAFEALKIPVEETPLDLDNALDGLSTGDVSAVVVIAPEPVRQFETLSTPGLHLLQWPAGGTIPAGASMTTIASSAYPGLANRGEVLRALGVDSYLKKNAASRSQDRLFLDALAQHAAALSKRGFDRLGVDLDGHRKRRLAESDPH